LPSPRVPVILVNEHRRLEQTSRIQHVVGNHELRVVIQLRPAGNCFVQIAQRIRIQRQILRRKYLPQHLPFALRPSRRRHTHRRRNNHLAQSPAPHRRASGLLSTRIVAKPASSPNRRSSSCCSLPAIHSSPPRNTTTTDCSLFP